jgi:hypothetical protein
VRLRSSRLSSTESEAGLFFGGLPEDGPWTPLALTRGQFFAILGLSLVLFLFVGGPVWQHVRGAHFMRIMVSYAAIPVAVAAALARNGKITLRLLLAGSAVLALIKLVVTAGLLIALALLG